MFPDSKELEVDPCTVSDIEFWLEQSRVAGIIFLNKSCTILKCLFLEELPQSLNLTVKLEFEGKRVELVISLPHLYPAQSPPEVYVRSDHFSRASQAQLNCDLQAYLATETESQEACLLSVISWTQEHQHLYHTEDKQQEKEGSPVGRVEEKFSRYWIYSHHIYSKIKRRNILDLSKEYQVCSFKNMYLTISS